VRQAGGRAGTAGGPAAIRRALEHFGSTFDVESGIDFHELLVADAGDLEVLEEDPAATHERLAEAVAALLDAGAVPIVIGGGNDLAFGSIQALVGRARDVGGINVSAHLDARPVERGHVSSGTPFRRMLSELEIVGSHFVEFAAHGSVNEKAHYDWLMDRNVRIRPLGMVRKEGAALALRHEIERLAEKTTDQFVSLSLDVFAAAYAPGVSDPGTEGLTPEEGRGMAFEAGHAPGVGLFELMELNPRFDSDGRTARLAAMLLCAFLAGLTERNMT
jgi:formiminoglutamase/guanidinobutyrase